MRRKRAVPAKPGCDEQAATIRIAAHLSRNRADMRRFLRSEPRPFKLGHCTGTGADTVIANAEAGPSMPRGTDGPFALG